ncbi:hypothetical protein H105_03787 [Trichophyton soudanense CBS 452.61]|uniref:CENP-V/GFA domain-containing protein n=1 Tax=Trichophyton soudanense CBS 452.61 TaxID=1215331 RepID=A0A022XVY0_TRISD|nr:hypothetical protein H105_03787 [Trichophyton soudanense CBS 452.61]EZG06838.1 hypothetical protein H106_03583 [Trichophyton rubrum CBS 735.88]
MPFTAEDFNKAMAPSTDERTTYKGNCHCGNIRFIINNIAPLEKGKAVCCNCSSCIKHGYLLIYPRIEDVVFTHGSMDSMSEYRCATMSRPHKFCGNCGTPVMIQLEHGDTPHLRENIAVNIRTLEDVDEVLDKIQFLEFDGKHEIGEEYTLPPV